MCETANQQSISSHMVVYMACKMRCRWLTFRRCFVNRALSRNRSLRDAIPGRHLFVWFAKHCLAEHCLSFRGDADECEKQFCFVFRICLAFFYSRLWRPLRKRLTVAVSTPEYLQRFRSGFTWTQINFHDMDSYKRFRCRSVLSWSKGCQRVSLDSGLK